MNPIVFALRHPITMIMLVVALIGGGSLALTRMRIDIFPPINQPSIYVFTNYGGYDPFQMEGLLVSPFELWFQFVDGVRSMESRSIQQVAVVKLSFYPDTDMSKAMAQVVSVASRAQATQPDGTLPPLIMQMDAGNVPVGYLVFRTQTRSLGEIGDLAMYRVRPLLQTYVPGTVSTAPYGSSIRAITVSVDPDKLRSTTSRPRTWSTPSIKGTPSALRATSTSRAPCRSSPTTPWFASRRISAASRSSPAATSTCATWPRSPTPPTSTTAMPWWTAASRSTCRSSRRTPPRRSQVVSDIKKAMPVFKSVLPEDVDVSFAFDESPTVVTAVNNVATEGLIGAALTGLMILVFLRDWRSVIVVVFNIPMALLGSLCGLWLTGNTINIMTLGGLALAIGILVDEATVEIENIHVQMGRTPSLSRAVLNGNHITAVPRLLALLVHPVGVHPCLPDGRAGAVAVRAAGAGGRLRHDLVVPPLQHGRAGAVGVAAEAPRSTRDREAHRNSFLLRHLPVFRRSPCLFLRPGADRVRRSRRLAGALALARGAGLRGRLRCAALGPGHPARDRTVSRRSIRASSWSASAPRPAPTSRSPARSGPRRSR